MFYMKMLKCLSLGLVLCLNSTTSSEAFSWSLSCTENGTKNSFDNAMKTKAINKNLNDCIANRKKAEGNPNSTNAFLSKCQKNAGKMPSSLAALCKKAEGYSVKGSILSNLSKQVSKKVLPSRHWNMKCNMATIKSDYKKAAGSGVLSKNLVDCIDNKKAAEANVNATTTFIELCQEIPASGRLEALCEKAQTYTLKDSLASKLTKKGTEVGRNLANKAKETAMNKLNEKMGGSHGDAEDYGAGADEEMTTMDTMDEESVVDDGEGMPMDEGYKG